MYLLEKCRLVVLCLTVWYFSFWKELSQPSVEHLACQAELRRVERSRRLALDEFESDKQFLEKQLQSEVNDSLLIIWVLSSSCHVVNVYLCTCEGCSACSDGNGLYSAYFYVNNLEKQSINNNNNKKHNTHNKITNQSKSF